MPNLTCILHGSLEDYLGEQRTSNKTTLNFAHAPSIEDVLSSLKISREYLQFALADGHYIEAEHWNKPLKTDLLQLWPRIAGG